MHCFLMLPNCHNYFSLSHWQNPLHFFRFPKLFELFRGNSLGASFVLLFSVSDHGSHSIPHLGYQITLN